MDRFQVELTRAAQKDLRKIPPKQRLKILKEIRTLIENPFPEGTRNKKIRGAKPPLYRLRVGDWRAIYRLEGRTVIILLVINRRDLETSLKELL